MNKYIIYCTEEQTRKALNLGAPIEIGEGEGTILCRLQNYHTYKRCIIPTAEQMIGWIRKEYNIHPRIDCEGSENYVVQLQFINSSKDINVENNKYKGIIGHKGYSSPEEATHAAINSALEYLENKIQ